MSDELSREDVLNVVTSRSATAVGYGVNRECLLRG